MKWKLRPFFKKFERPLLIVAASAGLTGLLINLDFNLLEANLYDLRMARGIQPQADPSIVLVTIDDRSTKALDELSPLTLDIHTHFMEALEKLNPKAVGYLVDMNQVNQANPDLFAKEWGTRFVESANRMRAAGTMVEMGTFYESTGEVFPPYPLSSLPHALAMIHKDGNVFGQDKITRRALVHWHGQPSFHLALAQDLGLFPKGEKDSPRGTFNLPELDARFFFFRYHGSTILNSDGKLVYNRIHFIDVINGKVPKSAIEGKIVLVGTLSKEDSADFGFTPYSKFSYQNPKLAIHANILDSVIHNDGIVMTPKWLNWFTSFAVTTFVVGWVLNSTPLYGVFATLALTFIFFIGSQLLFQDSGIWIRESQPLVGIFLGYYLVVPYRLIREYKKRWDYQKKNELLTQVEELKRNFLSLVTHDLKTPVARIQGLAEVLLRKSDHLLERDKDTLHHIISSTEELNRFISSILELSKLETNNLRLNLESKDINQIIERLAENFKAQARSNQIKINLKLEPLFPIKMDSSLITKVMSNLIDNAIKYSHSGSEILIESREQDNWVQISVADQGIGMTPEERENLFTRFYRIKNDATAQISGTGLGLYLTKYFIEAHEGHVEVESEKGKGSTFKIYLPIDGASDLVSLRVQAKKSPDSPKETLYV